MEIKNAEILRIGELQTFDSGFKKVEWVIKTQEDYPQILKLQSNKDNADNLLKYNKIGDIVDININLKGREWTNKDGETIVFNTIEAWKVVTKQELINQEDLANQEESESDLPF